MPDSRKLFIFLIYLFFKVVASKDVPVIKTTAGEVSGIIKKSYDGEEYMSYSGIPFAESPTGNLRFKVINHVNFQEYIFRNLWILT